MLRSKPQSGGVGLDSGCAALRCWHLHSRTLRFLRQRLRSSDVVGRYGGEEFAIILANTERTNAMRLLEQLRKDFAAVQTETETGSFSVTFSAGVASMPQRGDVGELLIAADRALYRAKSEGRNRVAEDTAEGEQRVSIPTRTATTPVSLLSP